MPLRHGGSCKRFPWSPPKNGWVCTVSAAVLSGCPEAVSFPCSDHSAIFPLPGCRSAPLQPAQTSRRRTACPESPHIPKIQRRADAAYPPGTSADGAAGGADEDECNISPGGMPLSTHGCASRPRKRRAARKHSSAQTPRTVCPKGTAPDRETVRPASGCTPKRPFPGVLRYFVTFSSIELPLSPRAAASARYRSTPCVRLRASSP